LAIWLQAPALSTTFYVVNISILLVLLFCSAMVSGSEVAFFSLSSDDLKEELEKNPRATKRLALLLQKPQQLLATILILNNFINVAIVTLSTYVTIQVTGGSSAPQANAVATLTIVVTFIIVFFGEVVPKVWANQNNMKFARRMAAPLSLFAVLFRPLSWLLMRMGTLLEDRLEKRGLNISVHELNTALDLATTANNTTENEKGILKGIVNFSTLSVKQVMRFRPDITAFDVEMDFHQLMDQINKNGYSRIPCYRETIDNIEGILYIKDLLPYLEKEDDFEWQSLLHQGFFVPDTKKVNALLKDFQDKRVHMAIVVDEYGGTSGLITLEDIIEEIVGEINDEFDDDDVAYNKLDENTFVFEGKTSLNDFCKITEVDASTFDDVKGESESLGGLLLELNNKLPRNGDKIPFNSFLFTVVAVDARRIKRVRVSIKRAQEEIANAEKRVNEG